MVANGQALEPSAIHLGSGGCGPDGPPGPRPQSRGPPPPHLHQLAGRHSWGWVATAAVCQLLLLRLRVGGGLGVGGRDEAVGLCYSLCEGGYVELARVEHEGLGRKQGGGLRGDEVHEGGSGEQHLAAVRCLKAASWWGRCGAVWDSWGQLGAVRCN